MSLLSDRLISARKAADLTQREAADSSSVSRTTIATLEAGSYENPSLGTLEALARAYGTSVYALLKPHGEDGSDPFEASPENEEAPAPTAATR